MKWMVFVYNIFQIQYYINTHIHIHNVYKVKMYFVKIKLSIHLFKIHLNEHYIESVNTYTVTTRYLKLGGEIVYRRWCNGGLCHSGRSYRGTGCHGNSGNSGGRCGRARRCRPRDFHGNGVESWSWALMGSRGAGLGGARREIVCNVRRVNSAGA